MSLRDRWQTVLARARRIERREVREFVRWLERTRNLVQLTVLVAMPVIIGLITAVSNREAVLPFVLFPPLASGTYTLFAEPEGRYSNPLRFVGGMTVGASCGSGAVLLANRAGFAAMPSGDTLFVVSPVAAALAVFATGVATWGLSVELPSAFATALIALIVPIRDGVVASLGPFVASVVVSSAVVAAAFHVWHDRIYERRAEYLYQSTKGDDHVLVPMRGDHSESSAMLAARLAGAHDAGKVVLLDIVDDERVAIAERDRLLANSESHPDGDVPAAEPWANTTTSTDADPQRIERAIIDVDGSPGSDTGAADAAREAGREAAVALKRQAKRIETQVGVPCQILVAASDDRAGTVIDAALRSNCDLIVAPYEQRHGALTGYIRELFEGPVDVLVHRPNGNRTRWSRVLVPVRSAGDVAHAMVDFGKRLVGPTGYIALCHCIGPRGDRRRAESMLADLAETVSGAVETRVSREEIDEFLATNATNYDIVFLGASRDRSAASRFISPPTFERIQGLDCDVAILDRNFRY